ncbi:hypothetical protein AB0G32_23150 [Streptomyces sp. NPDC023723]|uniref:effector-associated constant component EACC1 n=1 Tax=Streptomyces sp. NPDC023723 TaxID=3154323 RepID=UPI0033D70DD4
MGERLRIRFRADGPDHEQELRSLLGWLTEDRALRGHVTLEPVLADTPDRMSPELELVLAVISSAAGALQLPLSYLAWRHSRGQRTPPAVTVQVVGSDPAEVEELVRRLSAGVPDESEEAQA